MVEGANLNEKKRLWVRCQHSPCLLYSPFGFCFPLNSFMFPRIINSHFSTGQEVHSWTPPLPASLLCPCCPVTAAQTQTMPGHIHTGHLRGSMCPTAGHREFRVFRQAHAAQEEQREGRNPAVSSRRAAADRWDGGAVVGRCGAVQEGLRCCVGGLEAGPQPAVQRLWEQTLLSCQLHGGTQRSAKLHLLGEELRSFFSVSSKRQHSKHQ